MLKTILIVIGILSLTTCSVYHRPPQEGPSVNFVGPKINSVIISDFDNYLTKKLLGTLDPKKEFSKKLPGVLTKSKIRKTLLHFDPRFKQCGLKPGDEVKIGFNLKGKTGKVWKVMSTSRTAKYSSLRCIHKVLYNIRFPKFIASDLEVRLIYAF